MLKKLQTEDDKLNPGLEDSHGDSDKMKLVLEKRIDLYKRYLKSDTLNEIERLTLQNLKEWTMSHLLNLIIEHELREKIRELTKRVYSLEKVVQKD